MVQRQKTRASDRQPVEPQDNKTLPDVTARITPNADPAANKAEALADTLARTNEEVQGFVDRWQKQNAIEAKKKAFEDGFNLGPDQIDKRIEGMTHNEAESYLDVQNYMQGTEDRAELVRRVQEASPGQKVEVADQFIRENMENATTEEMDTIMPMLLKARNDAVAADLKSHQQKVFENSRSSLATMSADLTDNEGRVSPDAVETIRERARSLPGVSESEGVNVLVQTVADRAIQKGRPELMEDLKNSSVYEYSADTKSQIDEGLQRAEVSREEEVSTSTYLTLADVKQKVADGTFTQTDAEKLRSNPNIDDAYLSNDNISSWLVQSRANRNEKSKKTAKIGLASKLFLDGQYGTRKAALDLTNDEEMEMWNQARDRLAFNFSTDISLDDPQKKATVTMLEKAAENGSPVEFDHISNIMNAGFTGAPSGTEVADNRVPDTFLQAASMVDMAEGNPQAMQGIRKHMSDGATEVMNLYRSFREGIQTDEDPTTPKPSAEQARQEAYKQTQMALSKRMTPEEYDKSEVKKQVGQAASEIEEGWLTDDTDVERGETEVKEVPTYVKNSIEQKMHRYAKLTGSMEQSRKLALRDFKQNHSQLDGIWVNHGGRGLPANAEETIQNLKKENMGDFAKALGMAPENLNPSDITYIPDPDDPSVMLPVYQMHRPITEKVVDLRNQSDELAKRLEEAEDAEQYNNLLKNQRMERVESNFRGGNQFDREPQPLEIDIPAPAEGNEGPTRGPER